MTLQQLICSTALAALLVGPSYAAETEIPKIGPDELAFSVKNMDTSVSPAVDFYRYASGKWQDRMQRPADKISIGAIPYQAEVLKAELKATLARAAAEAASAPEGSPVQQAGDFYKTYMDIAARDAADIAPLRGELDQIAAIGSLNDVARYLGHTARSGGAPALAAAVPNQDLVDNKIYKIYAGAGSLGLNKHFQDVYLDQAGSKRKRAYAAYVRDVLKIGHYKPEHAAEIADMIVALETKLYGGMLTPVEMADPRNYYHPMSFDQFQALIPSLDMKLFFESFGLPVPKEIVNSQARYYPVLANVLKQYSLEDIKDYLAFRLIEDFSGVLTTKFEAPDRALHEALTGIAKLPPREERAISLMQANLGQPLSRVYVDQFFSEDSKAATIDMIGRIKAAFIARIKTRQWLSEETRAEALKKATAISYAVGYPDKWIDYSGVDIGPDLVSDLINLGRFNSSRMLAKYGKLVERDQMADAEHTLPMILNAAYAPQINGFEVTAAIVQPPMYMPEMDAAVNFCRLGAVIGHEMTHGFDSGGRRFDAEGRMRDWWTKNDATAFLGEADKLIEQADAFEVLPGLHPNGKLNVKENMADVGGITLAYAALKSYLAAHPDKNVKIDGLTPAQRCFISWAQLWTEERIEQRLRSDVANDPHSPNIYRTVAPLRHVDAFYTAFGIKQGDPMWLPPDKRVHAW